MAVFDTAFHTTLPAAAQTYALPRTWRTEWGIHRYGFHGLSHAYCARRAAEMLGHNGSRLIIAHLGNGASVSAVRNGICMDTSMGFTPLEGEVMGTRSGSLDPGVLLYVLRRKGLTVEQLDHALNYESGLLGLSGISSDMRRILKEAPNSPDARLALEVYIHRLVQTIGAMAATLGGVDGLVFTAGVGENSAQVRELVCENLGHLGLELDTTANARCKPDADIASRASPGRILVISTREDLTIVRETRRLIRSEAGTQENVPRETINSNDSNRLTPKPPVRVGDPDGNQESIKMRETATVIEDQKGIGATKRARRRHPHCPRMNSAKLTPTGGRAITWPPG